MNDLISREALKEALHNFFDGKVIDEPAYILRDVFCYIESAPTVEANSIIDGLNNEIDDLAENLAWYINERNRLLKERRPQGEWLKNANEIYKCSLCGAYGNPNYFRFCPNCGALMKGGVE